MGLAERISAARTFERERFKTFAVDGAAVGWVRHDLAARLRQFTDVFAIGETAVTFVPGLNGVEERSAVMAKVARSLAAQRLLTPWRSETYDIGRTGSGACLFRLERAAVRFFGFTAHAVHVNGLVEGPGQRSMWIARRSDDKAIDAGMLDNMVGGGLASGLTVRETLVKEAWEEAGIPRALAAGARPEGTLEIVREVPEGLHAEVIHVHDLVLPADFVPSNQDGEVSELRLVALEAVRAEIEGSARYTVDAAMVAMDCLVRAGVLDGRWREPIRARVLQ
jgi:8-oxo-dGTP pyrophosphatase MutT (NUDIX family)